MGYEIKHRQCVVTRAPKWVVLSFNRDETSSTPSHVFRSSDEEGIGDSQFEGNEISALVGAPSVNVTVCRLLSLRDTAQN